MESVNSKTESSTAGQESQSSKVTREEFLQAVQDLIARWATEDMREKDIEIAMVLSNVWSQRLEDPALFHSMAKHHKQEFFKLREIVFSKLPPTYKYLFADGTLETEIMDVIENSEQKRSHKKVLVNVLADLFSLSTLQKYKESYGEDSMLYSDLFSRREKNREEIMKHIRDSVPVTEFKVANTTCKCRA